MIEFHRNLHNSFGTEMYIYRQTFLCFNHSIHFEQRKHNKSYYETVTRKKFGFATDIKTNDGVHTLSLSYHVFLHAGSNYCRANFYLTHKGPIKLAISTQCLTLAKTRGDWSAPHSSIFTLQEKATDINWIGKWASPRTNLDLVPNKTFCLCQKSNPGCPAHYSPSLYWDNMVCLNLLGK